MQRWNLLEIDAPDGTRDPVVLATADDARAVLIRFAPGQELGDHQVMERAWMCVIEGSVTVDAGGETYEAPPGTFVTFEPRERRAVRSEGGARIVLMLAPWPGEGHYRGDKRASQTEPGAGGGPV